MRDGVFRNPEDLTRAYKLAESMVKDGGKLDAITKLQSFKDLTATIKVRTAGKKDYSATFDDGSFSAEGLQAMADLRGQLLQWAQKNPEAGPIEQEEAVAKFGASILKRVPDRDATDTPFYNREGIETPNTFGAKPPMQMPPEGQGGANPAAVTRVPNPLVAPSASPSAPAPLPETDAMGNPIGGAAVVMSEGVLL